MKTLLEFIGELLIVVLGFLIGAIIVITVSQVHQIKNIPVTIQGIDGVGAGVIIDDQLITSIHVLGVQSSFEITLPDGTKQMARFDDPIKLRLGEKREKND